MKIRAIVVIIITVYLVSGCSWLKLKKISLHKYNNIVTNGKILDSERLNKGGNLLLLPFSAGNNVVSDERLDKISIWVIRGIYDILGNNDTKKVLAVNNIDKNLLDAHSKIVVVDNQNNVVKIDKQDRFELFFSEDSEYIDFILKGQVISVRKDFFLKRWIFRSKKLRLSVKGSLIEKTTGKTILYFEDERTGKNKDFKFNNLSLNIGHDIGRFLLSGIK